MLSGDRSTLGALRCGRGCVGGKRHYRCSRPRKEGAIVGGGLSVVCSNQAIKIVEAPVDKAVLMRVEATLADGTRMNVLAAVMPPVIPGMSTAHFPACPIVSIGKPYLLKIASVADGVPVKPFMGVRPRVWRNCLQNPCSRKRFSFASRLKIPSGEIPAHTVRKSIPQLPPVFCRTGGQVVCQYCKQTFGTFAAYAKECAGDCLYP